MDNGCAKCGRYSGGSTLCLICQKVAIKKNKKKVRKKKEVDHVRRHLRYIPENG